MKLLIFSDSHGSLQPMRDAITLERPDVVIHLGDYARDAEELSYDFTGLPILSVRGNCGLAEPPRSEVLVRTFEGVKIFGVHGHRHGVKSGLLRLELAAREENAQLALFGHTHVSYCHEYEGLWLLNPGTCGGCCPTYGIAILENGTVQCRVRNLYTEEGK